MTAARTVSFDQISTVSNHCRASPKRVQSACELCHITKEKCHFDGLNSACARCYRLGRICRPRQMKRMGRKPAVKGLPYGCYSVTIPETSCQRRPTFAKRVSLDKIPKLETPSLHTSKSVSTHISIPNCVRPVYTPNKLNACISSSHSLQRIDNVLTTKDGFFSVHRRFMAGQSFSDEFHNTVLILFNHSPQSLADAYNAILDLMSSQETQPNILHAMDFTLASRSLRYLMASLSSVVHAQDAAVAIFLGQIMLAFNALVPMGSSSRIITRGTLTGVKLWYSALQQSPELDTVTICPVFVDTLDCLIRREIPVIRYPETDRYIVDRLSGVCSPLLPLLYDLCERSHQAKSTASQFYGATSVPVDPYSDLEATIGAWAPTFPPHLASKYTISEIETMLAQARSYRTATLLIIHRLRYPLGVQDEIGYRYAEFILQELSPLRNWSPKGATGLGLDFPLLVAMVEIPISGEELFRAFERLRYRKRQSTDIFKFLDYVKEARRSGYNGLWFDLVNEGFHGDFLP